MNDFFTTFGRIRRWDFIFRILLIILPAGLVYMIMPDQNTILLPIFRYLVVSTALILFSLQFIKRLHDIGLSGWYLGILLIPGINLFFLFYVMTKRGTSGQNKYGENPILHSRHLFN